MKRGIVWLAVVALGILGYLYGPDMLSRFQRKPETRKDSTEEQMLALAKRWGAVVKWEDRIKPRGYLHEVYTIDVERALLRTPDERFAFGGHIRDVVRLPGDRLRVIVGPSYFSGFSTAPLWLDLVCPEEIVRPVIEAERDLFANYAVLATLREVRRPGLRVGKIHRNDETDVEIEMPYEFVASGECFEFVPLK